MNTNTPPTFQEALAIERIETEAQFRIVNHWRITLINKEFSAGLAEDERAAVERFNRLVDDHEEVSK